MTRSLPARFRRQALIGRICHCIGDASQRGEACDRLATSDGYSRPIGLVALRYNIYSLDFPLVIIAVLLGARRQLDSLTPRALVRNVSQNVRDAIEAGSPLVV